MDLEIIDVTARDGLQNEAKIFSTQEKVNLINKSIAVGMKRLEVVSFAHPKYIPQMADAEAVIEGLPQRDDITFIGLAMNERGVDRALNAGIDEVGLVVVASDSFAQKNQGQTRDGSVKMACDMIRRVKSEGRRVNVTIAASFGCPFEGEIEPNIVVDMAAALVEVSPREIALADTIGAANPWQVKSLFEACRKAAPGMALRGHFHNTRNAAAANVYAAMESGVTAIDVSIGGIGGCPFAPNATGNVPAEDVVYMLERAGYDTGVSLPELITIAKWLSGKLNKTLPGMVSKASLFPPANQKDNRC